MRIIAGSLRGRNLQGPGVGELSIRPTADRAREALFSILQQWPRGGFLDLCAGTGAVGLEAWSRGYSPVICIEREAKALAILRRNLQGTDVQVHPRDIRALVPESFRELAVVFSDPPYEHSARLWEEMAPRMRPWLQREGILVWETDKDTELADAEGWDLVNSRPYGAARFHFLKTS